MVMSRKAWWPQERHTQSRKRKESDMLDEAFEMRDIEYSGSHLLEIQDSTGNWQHKQAGMRWDGRMRSMENWSLNGRRWTASCHPCHIDRPA